MSITALTPSIIAKEVIRLLKNNLVMASKVDTRFQKEFKKVGDTITIRKPVEYTVRSGATFANQDVTEPSTTLAVTKQRGIDIEASSTDLTLKIDQFSDRYLKNAIIQLGHELDQTVCDTAYKGAYHATGTAGTPPNLAALRTLKGIMDNHSMDAMGRTLVLNPDAYNTILADFTTNFTNAANEKALKGSMPGGLYGFDGDIHMSQSIKTHTSGTAAATGATVNGASQTGTSVILAAAGNVKTIAIGDILTFAGCNSVNPRTKVSTGQLQKFTVTALATSDAGGAVTVSVLPSIVTSGAYQNVTASPTDTGAVVKITGGASATSAQNLAFCKDAVALAIIPMVIPDGVSWGARETDADTGLSVRIIKDYDITNDKDKMRLDILFGDAVVEARKIARLLG